MFNVHLIKFTFNELHACIKVVCTVLRSNVGRHWFLCLMWHGVFDLFGEWVRQLYKHDVYFVFGAMRTRIPSYSTRKFFVFNRLQITFSHVYIFFHCYHYSFQLSLLLLLFIDVLLLFCYRRVQIITVNYTNIGLCRFVIALFSLFHSGRSLLDWH